MKNLLFMMGIYVWFSLGGFVIAKQDGTKKPREILAHSLLFLPIMIIASLTEIVEILYVLIEGGWSGFIRRRDAQIEEASKRMIQEIFGSKGS